MDRAIQKLRPVPRLDERFDAGDLTLRVNQSDALLHGAYLGLADGGRQRMRLPVDVGFGDEPTGNLDSGTAQEVLAMFTALCRDEKVTLVMVTHDAVVAGAADRVIEIRDGVVVAAGEKETQP